MKICPNCGESNPDDATLCQKCAETLPVGEVVCPTCGTKNRSVARFCAKCGTNLRASAPAGGSGQAAHPPVYQTGMIPPQTILNNRYTVLSKLGKGGMGAVYLVADSRLGGKYWALKELSDAALKNPAERDTAIAAFKREATLLATLNHPNLARVVDFFQESGKYFLVMDRVEGQTLDDALQGRTAPFPEAQVLAWAVQLCDVLDYLHHQNPPIIFRDLKPGNIMLDREGNIRLIDFGVARLFRPGAGKDTTSLGTPGYAPPEQYGKGQTDARSDVYALGATLHQLFTLRDPGDQPFKFPPARSLNPALSQHVSDALATAVQQEPDDRWSSAGEMKKALIGQVKPVKEPVRKAYARTPYKPPATVPSAAPVYPAAPAYPAMPVQQAAAKPASRKTGCIIAAVLVGVLGVVGVVGLGAYGTITAGQTATALHAGRQTGTAVARANLTSTAKARLTATARAEASQTAAAYAAEMTQTAAALDTGWVVYGPSGYNCLPHDADDGYIETNDSYVDVRDFTVEATFYNPYSSSYNDFDIGFLVRYASSDNLRMALRSNGEWQLTHYHDGLFDTADSGYLYNMNTYSGGSNEVYLYVDGSWGDLYLNGSYVTSVDFSSHMTSGTIQIATGMFAGAEVTGYETCYDNFTVWELP